MVARSNTLIGSLYRCGSLMLVSILIMTGLFLASTVTSHSLIAVHAEKRYLAARMVGEILGMRADQRGLELNSRNHLPAKVIQVRDSFRAHHANVVAAQEAYAALGGTAEEVDALATAKAALAAANDYVERLIPLCEADDATGAAAISAANKVSPFDQAMAPANQLSSIANANLEAAAASADRNTRLMTEAATVTIVVGLVAMIWVWLTLRRGARRLLSISGDMETGASQVASASIQIAQTSQTLSGEASQQAEKVQSTSGSSSEADTVARRTSEDTSTAMQLLDETLTEVKRSVDRVGDLTASMARIETSTGTITSILAAIEKIAFQTNLLALNAAVEASRAGDAGAGFAVVADEVGRLAQLCTKASSEMAVQIDGASRTTREGRERVDAVTKSIGSVQRCSEQLRGLMARVSTGATLQSSNLHSIHSELSVMEQITLRTAAAAEQSAAASQELSSQASEMHDLARSLRGFVGAR
ncbi:methyl-accepting chemotaxis protein [Bryocella elongata]|uniref:Methyl-accepting chemotaxis protein n=1 Tax=Bryocella elongata TaxID=863522 RepID=A0A1H6C000_9BACT|nr:methyl-accepting chemotaxis protein [Bryocella elongata]SEG66213.1 methyl-accepting chemotaxis protein [Bryocella elongata]